MAVNIRFDYYYFRADKHRKRSTEQGLQFFGRIPIADICQWIHNYYQTNQPNFGEHGIQLIHYSNNKKWIKWVNAEFDNGILKLLFTFNDKQIDPRFLADNQDNVLAQPIPNDDFGQRTLLHMVINANADILCVQNVAGLRKDYLERLFIRLLETVAPDNYWQGTEPVTQDIIPCKPVVEITNITTDEILQVIHNGGLRGLTIVENEYQVSSFDTANHLLSQKTKITIRTDGNSFMNATRDTLIQWANRVAGHKSNFTDPTISLLVKDPQTGSEIEHEIIGNLIDGFGKKAYLNWEDRTLQTHAGIANELPLPLEQFFDLMIARF